ncbi:mitochondrial RNAediting factor 1 [Actinidia rufa]|uniref:Mitochondrial RNAediting factor 1 n=1 Tax=Actinidia rufa TaxID=165716 RepID=A0A7J0DBD9_9ERIC|nr:mitochondrial RNAediting factor 1 [Actinidia rufa]
MHINVVPIDTYTLCSSLTACSDIKTVEFGKQLHTHVIKLGWSSSVFVGSALIDLYAKLLLIDDAAAVFDEMPMRNTDRGRKEEGCCFCGLQCSVYTGKNGHFKEVIGLYNEMLMEGVKPDGVVFVTVISACGHTGQVNLGIEYFESMVGDFGLDPKPEHYSCLIDLLCRAGELEKAWKLVNEMSYKANASCTVSMWGALLSACNECGNVDLAKLAAQRALELDPQNVGIYVLLSNMYARYGMWNEISQLREVMMERLLEKDVGCSWIAVRS